MSAQNLGLNLADNYSDNPEEMEKWITWRAIISERHGVMQKPFDYNSLEALASQLYAEYPTARFLIKEVMSWPSHPTNPASFDVCAGHLQAIEALD